MKLAGWLDPTLKVIATLIAVFGVWRFFEERAQDARIAREDRALGYIERFGGSDMIEARAALLDFWRRNPEFASEVRARALTPREYEGFVNAAYPVDPKRGDIDAALLRMLIFYDELAFCHRAGTCDDGILLGFFCDHARQHDRLYAPFHARLAAEIGSNDLGRHLHDLAADCPE